MKRLALYGLAGAAGGTAWGHAWRIMPAWLYVAITAAMLLAVVAWALWSLRQLRAMKRELGRRW